MDKDYEEESRRVKREQKSCILSDRMTREVFFEEVTTEQKVK